MLNVVVAQLNKMRQDSQGIGTIWLCWHNIGIAAIKNPVLFEDVIRHKKVFFNASYANYDACLAASLKLLPADETISGLQIDDENMVNAGMMYQQPPDFSQIIESIKKIERDINLW